MRPKITSRKNAAGEFIYTYLCSTKERSRSAICSIKNVNGNTLDAVVVGILKKLSENKDELIKQLEIVRKHLLDHNSGYEDTITNVKAMIFEEEQKVASLTLSLARAEGSVAEKYAINLIEKSHRQIEILKERLCKIESIAEQNKLRDEEFHIIRERLLNLDNNIETQTVEKKREIIKMLVRRVIWDGETIQLYLFGSDKEYIFAEPSGEDSE